MASIIFLFFLRLLLLCCFSAVITAFRFPTCRSCKHTCVIELAFINYFPYTVVLVDEGGGTCYVLSMCFFLGLTLVPLSSSFTSFLFAFLFLSPLTFSAHLPPFPSPLHPPFHLSSVSISLILFSSQSCFHLPPSLSAPSPALLLCLQQTAFCILAASFSLTHIPVSQGKVKVQFC